MAGGSERDPIANLTPLRMEQRGRFLCHMPMLESHRTQMDRVSEELRRSFLTACGGQTDGRQ